MSSVNPFPDELMDDPHLATLVVSPGLVVLSATPAAERLLGASSGGLIGVTMHTLVPIERRPELSNFEAVLAGGGGRRLRSALCPAGGRPLDVSLTLAPRTDELGRITSVIARYEPARLSAQWVRASLPPRRRSVPSSGPLSAGPPSARPLIETHRDSDARFTPAGAEMGLDAHLLELDRHLCWLEERLSQPPELSLLRDPREHGLALSVVGAARELTARCRRVLATDADPERVVPPPPKVPRL